MSIRGMSGKLLTSLSVACPNDVFCSKLILSCAYTLQMAAFKWLVYVVYGVISKGDKLLHNQNLFYSFKPS